MRPTLAGMALALMLAGCTHASTAMLDGRTAVISASGGAGKSMADVQQRAFLEAAKLTQAHGFRYFVVLGAENASQTGAIVGHGATFSDGNGGTFQGPSTVVPFVRPGTDVTIRMYGEADRPAGDAVWDSAAILAAQPATK